MAVSDWKTTPGDNIALGSIPLAEGQLTGAHVNDAFQQIMAAVAAAFSTVPKDTDFIKKSGDAMAGAFSRKDAGAFLYHVSPTAVSGRVFTQPLGAADPAGLQEGDIILDY